MTLMVQLYLKRQKVTIHLYKQQSVEGREGEQRTQGTSSS